MSRARTRKQWQAVQRRSIETAAAAPVVIAHRLGRMALAGPRPGRQDRREFQLMGAEKLAAAWESVLAMSLHAWQAQLAWTLKTCTQWWDAWGAASRLGGHLESAWAGLWLKGIAPVHRRATANARRLSAGRATKASSKRRRLTD